MSKDLVKRAKAGVDFLKDHQWAQKMFFWATFFNLRLLYPVQYLVLRELINCKSVLDLGCGRHSMVPILPKSIRTVGVEYFKPHYEEARIKARHTELIHADITKIDFPSQSFDAVVMLDVLEHLPKQEGALLLKKMETWAKRKIVIFTPNGFLPQAEFDSNPLMEHQSGWDPEEFFERGYEVFGVRGLKSLRKNDHAHGEEHKPYALNRLIDMTQVWTYYKPSAAFQLFCVKNL